MLSIVSGPYLTFFYLLTAFALMENCFPFFQKKQINSFVWWIVILLLIFFIGARFEVGGDWDKYLANFHDDIVDSKNLLSRKYPLFSAMNFVIGRFSDSVLVSNLFSSCIFVIGIGFFFSIFCYSSRWIALTFFYPLGVVLLGMGYQAQSVSIGMALIAFCLIRSEFLYAGLSVLGAAYFVHSTAMIALFLVICSMTSFSLIIRSVVYLIIPVSVIFFMSELQIIDALESNKRIQIFLTSSVTSNGVFIRQLFIVVGIVAFMFLSNRSFGNLTRFNYLVCIYCYINLFLAEFVSTIADRLLYWLLPFCAVWVAIWIQEREASSKRHFGLTYRFGVACFAGSFLLGWLLFGDNAGSWKPYDNWLVTAIF